MSLFDKNLITSPTLSKEQCLSVMERIFLGLYVLDASETPRATIVYVGDDGNFPLTQWFKENKDVTFSAPIIVPRFELHDDDSSTNLPVPVFRRHSGRPVIVLDCSTLYKGDAMGFMYRLSKVMIRPKPIVIIENITDIPAEDSIHDNPQYVEDILLHAWKEEEIHLSDIKTGDFSLKTRDFTVLFPIKNSKISNIRIDYLRNDNYGHIDYVKEFETFVKDYPEVQDWLKDKQYINDVIITALKDYIQSFSNQN